MTDCYFCQRHCDEDRDLWSEACDSFIHKRCLTWKLKRRKLLDYDPLLHAIAKEFRMARAAPGRRALECRNGHAYTRENTYIDARGSQQCRICSRGHWRNYQQRNAEKYRQMRKMGGNVFSLVAPPSLVARVREIAAAHNKGVSPFVRELLIARLPEWEEKFGLKPP